MSDIGSGQSRTERSTFTQPFKDLLAVLSSALHTRLDLCVVELQEELERTKQTLALFLLLLCGVSLGFILFNVFLVALFWQNGWIAAIGLLALVYLGVAAFAAVKLRKSILRPAGLFPATLAELAKDRDHLRAAAHEQ
ncbi:MAG TPA: phage holin family protein [Candidatus Binatia bacterium]|nr:phage holin family protein [Candidatus Binatia bacterium]